MSTINDSDQFLVQRGQTSYKQSAVDLMSTIQDTDYMLIQRGIESFKVTCLDVKDQLGGGGVTPPVLDSVVLSQDGSPDANRFTSKSFTSTTTNSGGAAATLEMTGTVTGNLNIKAGSDPITVNAYPGTSSTDVVLTLEGETNLGDLIQVGDTVTANLSYTPETDTISSVDVGASNTVLTLPTEKDIELFQVDDVVQADPNYIQVDSSVGTIPLNGAYGTWSNVFNGVISTSGDTSGSISPTTSGEVCEIEFNPPIAISSSLKIYAYIEYVGAIAVNDTYDCAITGNYGVEQSVDPSDANIANELRKITVKRDGTGGYLAGIKVDDKLLVDPNLPDVDVQDTKVVATDVSAKTITVDGGSWDTSNQSQVWSDDVSSATKEWLAFNGDLGNGADAASDVYGVIDATDWGFADTTVEVYLFQNGEVLVNDNPVTLTGASELAWASLGVVGDLESIKWKHPSQTYTLRAVRVGGKVLVDKANDSQVWSDYTSGDMGDNYEWTKAFDGDSDTRAINLRYSNALWDYTAQGGVRYNSKVEIRVKRNSAGPDIAVNGTSVGLASDNVPRTVEVLTGAGTLNTIEIETRNNLSNGDTGIYQVFVDGELLLDSGVRNLGDSKVSTTSAKQGSGTVSDITGAQVTVSPFTDNCFKEGQYLTVNKTINVDPKTDKITSYDDTTKVITVDGDTDLLQFAAGDSVFMTDNSGSGASTKTGYKLTTTDIDSVQDNTPTTLKYALASTYVASGVSDQTGLAFDQTWDVGTVNNVQSYIIIDMGTEGSTINVSASAANSNLSYSDDLINWTASTQTLIGGTVGGEGRYYWTAQFVGALGSGTGCTLDSYTPTAEIVLTFPGNVSTNPDLKYFKAEDVVVPGDDGKTWTGTTNNANGYGVGDPAILFDDTESPLSELAGSKYLGSGFQATGSTITFTTPITNDSGNVFMYAIREVNSGTFKVNGVDITTPSNSSWTYVDCGTNSITSLTFGDRTSSGGYVSGVQFFCTDSSGGGRITRDTTPIAEVKVVSVDTTDNKMTVDNPGLAQGDKVEYQTTGGVGTIATGGVNVTNKTITLTAAESGAARWIAENKAGTEFRVATATKPAVATTAYLTFSAAGAVTGYQATPVEPRAMDNKSNPKLTFPATFPDTGQAPDVEFPDANAYIQTSVQLKNSEGDSAVVASNTLVPQTNARSVVAACDCTNNAEELKAMGKQVATHDQRVADHTAAQRQQRADDFEAALERYSHDHD